METLSKNYQPKIVVLGGGGGAPQIALGIAEANGDALVVVGQGGFDHGGASGLLRDEYGTAAAGDSRGALHALSTQAGEALIFNSKVSENTTAESISFMSNRMINLIRKRDPSIDEAWLAMQMDSVDELAADFESRGNSLKGQAWGNLQLTAAAKESGSMNHAVKVGSILLGLAENHIVLQTSDTPSDIVLHDYDKDGNEVVIVGEGEIDEYMVQDPYNARIALTEPVSISEDLAGYIQEADLIIIAPGSDLTSVRPALLAEGSAAAFASMKDGAKIIALSNLAEDGVLPAVDAQTFITKLDELTNRDGQGRNIDGLMFNNAVEDLPVGVKPIVYDAHDLNHLAKARVVIGDKLVSAQVVHRDPNDLVAVRSSVHHDGERIGQLVREQFLAPMQAKRDLAA